MGKVFVLETTEIVCPCKACDHPHTCMTGRSSQTVICENTDTCEKLKALPEHAVLSASGRTRIVRKGGVEARGI